MKKPLLLVLLLATVVRLAYFQLVLPATWRGFVVDEREYFGGAVVLASGRGLSFWDDFLWTRAPGYPLLLGNFFRLFGHDELWPMRLLQLAISIAGIAVLYLLAARSFGPRVATLSSLLAAVYLPLVILPWFLLGETLFILLFGLALLVLQHEPTDWHNGTTEVAGRVNRLQNLHRKGASFASKSKIQNPAVAGFLLGLAALTRSTALLFVLLVALILWWRAGWQRAGVLLVTALLTLLPWTAYNYVHYGRLIVVDTTSGYNLWLAANGVRDGSRIATKLAEVEGQGVRQDHAYAQATNLIAADPLAFVGKGLKESGDLWAGNFSGEERLMSGYTRGYVPASHLLASLLLDDTLYLLLVPLAILGLVNAGRREGATDVVNGGAAGGGSLRTYVVAWIALNIVLAFVFFGVTRFRLAVVFFMLPFGAYALLNLRQIIRQMVGRDQSRPYNRQESILFNLKAIIPITAFLILYLPTYPLAETVQGVTQWGRQQHLAAGDALLAADPTAALAEYRLADPSLPETQSAIAAVYLRRGDIAAAGRTAAMIRPDYWGGDLVREAVKRSNLPQSPAPWTASLRLDYPDLDGWAWVHLPVAPVRSIALDESDYGYTRGFHVSEPQDAPLPDRYRWTRGRDSYLRFPLTSTLPTTLTLTLDGWRPDSLPPANIEVFANGQPLGTVVLDAGWYDYDFSLPPLAANRELVVQLRSDTFVVGGSDPRLLGFKLRRATLVQPRPLRVYFNSSQPNRRYTR